MEPDVETTDITVEILRDIRDTIEQTNVRLDQTNERLSTLEVRVVNEIVLLRADFMTTRDVLLADRDLKRRVERCEVDIADIKTKLP